MAVNAATIAKRYAIALFELTHEQAIDEQVLTELLAIRQILSDNPTLTQVLLSQRVSEEDKQQLLLQLTNTASPVVVNLIQMTYDYRRFAELPAIIKQYESMVNEAQGVMAATVTTAIALTADQVARLRAKLCERFDAQEIQLTQIVDATILGGVIVTAKNQVLDGSLATKLAHIRQQIIR